MMDNLCDYIKTELKELDRKAANGKLSSSDVQYGDILAHFKKNLLTADAMEEGSSYDSGRNRRSYEMSGRRSYDMEGPSNARGRNAKRDSMGRYSRRAYDDGTMAELREIMDSAEDDQVRQKIHNLINELVQCKSGC